MWILVRTTVMFLAIAVAFVAVLRVPRGKWSLTGVLAVLVGLALVVEVVARFMLLQGVNNAGLYNAFMPVEFLLVQFVLFRIRPKWKRTWSVSTLLGLVGIGYCYVLEVHKGFIMVEAGLLISLVLSIGLMSTLWSLANTSDHTLVKLPEFWLLMGLLLYFGGMVPLISLARFVFAVDQVLAGKLWQIAPILCTLRYGFTAYAAILAGRSSRTAHG